VKPHLIALTLLSSFVIPHSSFAAQAIAALPTLKGCAAKNTKFGPSSKLHDSATGTPVVTFVHPGGHSFPEQAPSVIVKFFQQHPKP
jgi:polyhydroxybutyrate depolymerase